jgi:hypothetical protein
VGGENDEPRPLREKKSAVGFQFPCASSACKPKSENASGFFFLFERQPYLTTITVPGLIYFATRYQSGSDIDLSDMSFKAI